ncbi:MAG: site-2 protease family protein [Minisyncoccia bacterium]
MPIDIIFSGIIFIFSVIIHEVSHGFMAYKLGDNTAKFAGRLTLNPIPHIDLFGSIILPLFLVLSGSSMVVGWAKPVPFNPYNLKNQRWGEAMVAIAGPLSNIFLAVIFGILIRVAVFPSLLSPFIYIVLVNLLLATFNLVPIPPLDGSKILFSLFPNKLHEVREFLERNGLFVLIFFVFFLWQYVYPIVLVQFNLLTGMAI